LLSHWQHENVNDDALELLEESNMIKLRMTMEQARSGFCFLQVPQARRTWLLSVARLRCACAGCLCTVPSPPLTSGTHSSADFLFHP
jgi:hypothetical protein